MERAVFATPSNAPPVPLRREVLGRLVRVACRTALGTATVGLGAGLAGCSRGGSGPREWYSNWDLAGGCSADAAGTPWRNALDEASGVCPGEDPSSERAAGTPDGWTWVFCGALWCSTSRRQAMRMRESLARVGHRAEVYAVLTGLDEPFTRPRAADALAWAGALGMSPRRVLFDPAEDGLRSVPQHLLIGPDGRTWYRFVGGLSTDDMVSLLEDFASGRRRPRVRRID
jgi:hypothetical protein